MEIKTQVTLILIVFFLFTLSIISVYSLAKADVNDCKTINRAVSMCGFFTYSKSKKRVCIKEVKKRFGVEKFNRCVKHTAY